MWTFTIFIIMGSSLARSTDRKTSYDQRQNGELNVQIGLKNLNIIALLKGAKEEYVDYDYAYDYSEMTIKPQHGHSTPKPLKATTTISNEEQQNSGSTAASSENTTVSIANSTLDALIIENIPNNTLAVNDLTTTASSAEYPTTTLPEAPPQVTLTRNQCRRGFRRNSQGKCEYRGQGTSNALRRIVKLAQKIKIGREYNDD